MGIVTEIKKFNRKDVEKALFRVGYCWRGSRRNVPRNIEKMVEGLPRPELELVLFYLRQINA